MDRCMDLGRGLVSSLQGTVLFYGLVLCVLRRVKQTHQNTHRFHLWLISVGGEPLSCGPSGLSLKRTSYYTVSKYAALPLGIAIGILWLYTTRFLSSFFRPSNVSTTRSHPPLLSLSHLPPASFFAVCYDLGKSPNIKFWNFFCSSKHYAIIHIQV